MEWMNANENQPESGRLCVVVTAARIYHVARYDAAAGLWIDENSGDELVKVVSYLPILPYPAAGRPS